MVLLSGEPGIGKSRLVVHARASTVTAEGSLLFEVALLTLSSDTARSIP